ncbi:MAG: hypothetical protein CVT48_01085 [Thermoplasmata archaeon HGW-Thermoplasmata-1]|nr:MAG: hypothetical protein CVT48_01085 [Thermoplasmata archaeon HGW-Thermoplasmata-1]
MEFRKTKVTCPVCNKGVLEAVELSKGNVSSYHCSSCGSVFDAVIFHDFENRKHYWLGKHRNHLYWAEFNKAMAGGVTDMKRFDESGMPAHLKTYLIEEIEIKNK